MGQAHTGEQVGGGTQLHLTAQKVCLIEDSSTPGLKSQLSSATGPSKNNSSHNMKNVPASGMEGGMYVLGAIMWSQISPSQLLLLPLFRPCLCEES